MRKAWQVIKTLFGFAEKLHTGVWLVEIFGGTAVFVAIRNHFSSKSLDGFSLVVGFVGSILVFTLPHSFYRAYLRQKGIIQLHKKFDQKVTTPEGQAPYFKRKIRIMLKNVSNEALEIDTPGWAADVHDLAIQPGDQGPGAVTRFRIEDINQGGWQQDRWLPGEHIRGTIPAGISFEVWVGLNHRYTDRELDLHDRQGKIGTLVLPVVKNGQRTESRIRVV